MKFTILTFSIALLLNGCSLNSIGLDDISFDNTKGDTSNNEVTAPEDKGSAHKTDESYLQIAKDLFVAGQYKQAYQISTNLAEKEHVEAQYLLGYMIYYGYGIPADIKQGTKWINVAADKGHRPAIEALVLIKHGLTPDNKCSAVSLEGEVVSEVKKEPQALNKEVRKNNSTDKNLIESSNKIASSPSQKNSTVQDVNLSYVKSSKVWDRYTIQLMIGQSKQSLIDFKKSFVKQNPDLKDYIITYQSKKKPTTYGVGFSTFKSNEDATIALNNLKTRIGSSSLWVKRLDKSEPMNLK